MVAYKGFYIELDTILSWKSSSELISGEVVYDWVKTGIQTRKTEGNRMKY